MRRRSLRLLRDQSKAREGFNRGIDGNRRGAPTLAHNCDHLRVSENHRLRRSHPLVCAHCKRRYIDSTKNHRRSYQEYHS